MKSPARDRAPARDRLPEKSKLPQYSVGVDWTRRYFDVGEEIEWIRYVPPDRRSRNQQISHEHCKGAISEIKQNSFGRVSYYVGEQFVLLEQILEARLLL